MTEGKTQKERYMSTDGSICATVWIDDDCSKLRLGISAWISAVALRRGRAKWYLVPFDHGSEAHPLGDLGRLGVEPFPTRTTAVVNYLNVLPQGGTVSGPWGGEGFQQSPDMTA